MTYCFITGTGTGIGKTFVTRGIARAAVNASMDVVAIKPIETGYLPDLHEQSDAAALCKAAKRELPRDCWYRAAQPLAPVAVSMEANVASPNLEGLSQSIRQNAGELTLVEGAGGVCVPLSKTENTTDFIDSLGCKTILVASNTLGVLSHTLTALHVLASIEATPLCIVLTHLQQQPEPSWTSNAKILNAESSLPIINFPFVQESDQHDDHLAQLAQPIIDLLTT